MFMNYTSIRNEISNNGFNFKCKIYSSMYKIYKENVV